MPSRKQQLHNRIYKITNADFSAALQHHRGSTGRQLESISKTFMEKKASVAYQELAAIHRDRLEFRWQQCLEETKDFKIKDQQVFDNLLKNKIFVWHTLEIDFGKAIDWNRLHLGKPIPGFSYFFWFQEAVYTMLRSNQPDVTDFVKQTVLSFFKVHKKLDQSMLAGYPVPFSHYKNNLACTGQLKVFVPGYLHCINEEKPDPRLIEAYLKIFLSMGRILKIQMDKEAKDTEKQWVGNVSIAGAGSLFQLACLFPEFKESSSWRKRATERFLYFAEKSFFKDGGYCERVWGYGTGALSYLTEGYLMAQVYGGFGKENDRIFENAMRRCFRWYAKTLGPNERQPTFGDGETTPTPYPRAMNLAARMFPNSKDRFLGVDRTKSYLLKPSEIAIFRNGDDNDSTYINLSFAKYAGWHSHYDQLSMNLWAYDTPILEELDRWGPYHCPLDILVRAPEAHNLFLVDGMVYDSRRHHAHDVHWLSNNAVDCFTACHRAYRYEVYEHKGPGCFNMNGIVRRTVIFVKDPGYALVMDSAFDENHDGFNRAVSQYWHSPFEFKAVGPGKVRTKGKTGCLLLYARTDGLRRLECTTDFAGDEVEHSHPLRDRYTLRARRWGKVEEPGTPGFATLLMPFKGKLPKISITPLSCENGQPYRADGFAIETPYGTDRILLNPERRTGFKCDGKPVKELGRIILASKRGTFTWKT